MFNLFLLAVLSLFSLGNCSSINGDIIIGELCSESSECVGIADETSFCDTDAIPQICACMPTYVASTLKNDCLKISQIGETCSDLTQCKAGLGGEFSDCLGNEDGEKICNCTNEAVPISAGLGFICEKKATSVGDACYTNEQCTPNLGELSECNTALSECECKSDGVASADKSRCLAKGVLIGGRCEVDGQCVGESDSSGCSSGICVCRNTHVSSDNRQECLPIRNEAGQPCKEIQQCQQGDMGNFSNCTGTDPNNKECQCHPEAISAPGDPVCRRIATHVGDACRHEAQCLNLGISECSGGFCICKEEAIESSYATKCLAKSYIDDPCEDINQCGWIEGSTCQNKNVSDPSTDLICRCSADYVNVEFARDVCYLKAQAIGQSCASHPIQCIDLDDSQCLRDDKICACHEPTQVVSGDRKKCLSRTEGLNTTCVESAQCSAQNAECITTNATTNERQCKCLRNEYVEGYEQIGKCLKIADEIRVGCEEQHQCTLGLGSLSECRDGHCFCKLSYTYYEGQCYFPANFNGICNLDGECKAGVNNYTYCNDNNRCSCVEGAIEHNNLCYGTKVVGDFCNIDTECTVTIGGHVGCDPYSKRCACDQGYRPEFQNSFCFSSALKLGTNVGIILLALMVTFSQKLF